MAASSKQKVPPTSEINNNRFGLSNSAVTSVSGSVSGFAATFAKQPIQRLKWIRQVDSGASVPYNVLLRRTIQSDGMLGLFRGSVAGIMRNVPHSALVYTIYPKFEEMVLASQQRAKGQGSFSTRFWAGYATTFFATLITHPLDTLRVRLSVTHGNPSTPTMIKSVIDTGGFRALYQGFGATLVGAGPRGAVGFGVFETLKDGERLSRARAHTRTYSSLTRSRLLSLSLSLSSCAVTSDSITAQQLSPTSRKLLFGYVAGFCAETAIYPLDTVRRRQQALGDSSPLGKLGQFDVIKALVHVGRTEGVIGLFKGLSLNLVKNPIATAVSFTVNDLVKDFLKAKREKDEGR